MKKILLAILAVSFSWLLQNPVLAHEFNPYQGIYQQISQQELKRGRVQFVYVLKDEDGAALSNATLKYFDYTGQEHTTVSDAQGLVRLMFLQGQPFVQVKEVVTGQQALPIVGEAVTASAERQDFKKGVVEYYVLQRAMGKQVVHIFEAD